MKLKAIYHNNLFCALKQIYKALSGREYTMQQIVKRPVRAAYYVHPLGGGHIIFAFSAVRRRTWFPDILGNSSYPIFTKFGMQVYWVNSLYGIAIGGDSSIAN